MSHCCKSQSDKKIGSVSYLMHEVMHHTLYSVVAVVASMVLVGAFFNGAFFQGLIGSTCAHCTGASSFHILHYAHMFFAGATAVMSFRRYSSSVFGALSVGILVPPIFCTFSDVIFPYLGGKVLGLDMALHLCFLHQPLMVGGILLVGSLVGLFVSYSQKSDKAAILSYALGSHFLHELVSALASLIYLATFGGAMWMLMPVRSFLLLLTAVVVPCLLSDLIVPVVLAKFINASIKWCNRC